jgi:hypothetical protein
MLKISFGFISLLFVLLSNGAMPSANAVEVLRTYQHTDHCVQPIYYPSTKAIEKMGHIFNELNDVTLLPVLSPKSVGLMQSRWLETEYQQVETFVRKWFAHFEKLNDSHLQNQTVCIGIFDDEHTVGMGNHQYGSNTLLFGKSFLKNLKHDAKDAGHKTIPSSTRDMVYLHEFAHLLQKMNQPVLNLPSRPDTTLADLHADCVAGFLYRLDRTLAKDHTQVDYFYREENHTMTTSDHHAFAKKRPDFFTMGQHLAKSIHEDRYLENGTWIRGRKEQGKVDVLETMDSASITQECLGSHSVRVEVEYWDF